MHTTYKLKLANNNKNTDGEGRRRMEMQEKDKTVYLPEKQIHMVKRKHIWNEINISWQISTIIRVVVVSD